VPSLATRKFQDCKAILFDFGGTLDSDGEHWLDRFYALYEDAGLNIPLDQIKRAFYSADRACYIDPEVNSLGLRELMRLHLRLQFEMLRLNDPEKEERLSDAFCTECESFLGRNARLLRQLRQCYRLGVVSNFYGNVAVLCKEAGFSDIMELILDSAMIGIEKPDPRIFQLAIRKLNLSPVDIAFVGDSFERDMVPTRGLDMKTIWLKGSNPRIPSNAGPVDSVISSLAELEALIS